MKLWRTKEIFKISGFSKVRRAIKSGELRSRMNKGVRYVEHAWLVEWLGFDPLLELPTALPENRAPGQPKLFKDRTGQRYGKLVALRWERRKKLVGGRVVATIYWTCRCDCGNLRLVPSNLFREREGRAGLCCLACSAKSRSEKVTAYLRQRQRRHFPKLPEASPYARNYRWYRGRFTAEQQARYEELMRERKGRQPEALAVDVVMREPVPGYCCERCLKQAPSPVAQPSPKQVAEPRRERKAATAQRREPSTSMEAGASSAVERLRLLRTIYERRQAGQQGQAPARSMVA